MVVESADDDRGVYEFHHLLHDLNKIQNIFAEFVSLQVNGSD